MNGHFDPSLLYAECSQCGSPVLWLSDASEDILWMGIAPGSLDADCLLLYEGCPNCVPGQQVYESRFIRLGRRARRPTAN
jgi:hypothetical protein